jgi:hypothetical protein
LELIKKSGNRIESLMIVNGTETYGEDAYMKLLEYLTSGAPQRCIETDIIEIFAGGFTQFTRSDRLSALVDRLTT